MNGVWGVIPARWASTRFPGKMLHPIAGKPLLARVVDRVRRARRLDGLLVATDDERIRRAAEEWGVETVMTDPELPSGTDRVAAALRGRPVSVAVNIQGDEPLIDPAVVDALAGVLLDNAAWDMATAAAPLTDAVERDDPSVVKVVLGADGRALYFSRSLIPYIRDPADAAAEQTPYLKHVGIYAYRTAFLERLVKEPPTLLERMEKLEQLRALHLGAHIHVLTVPEAGIGVDTPADAALVEALLSAES